MTTLIGTKYNPINPYTGAVDIYTELTVIAEKPHAVKFSNGASARIMDGKIQGFRKAV